MPDPAIVTAAKAARARLLAGEREAVAPLLDAYTRLYQRTAADLKDLLALIESEVVAGATPGPARLFERDRLQKIVGQVAGELQRLGTQAAEITTARQSELITQAQADAKELHDAALSPRPRHFDGPTWLHVPTDQLEHLVGIAGDGSPLKTLLSGLAPDGEKQFLETLLQGVALGLDERDIAADVRDIFGGNMSRALRVVRTEEMRAYRESTRLGFEANSHVLSGMEWFASLSEDTCPACLGNHGKVFPVGYVMESHPNCRCVLVPVTKTWEELGFPAGVEPPPTETGPEWFARQPAEKQRKILGAGGFEAYQKGEVTLADFVGHKHNPEWGGMYHAHSLKDTLKFAANSKFSPASPAQFVAARDASKRAAFLSGTPEHELTGHRLFLSADGKSGYALDEHGDLQNVFNNGVRGMGGKAVIHAIKNGARTLDCFAGYLRKFYGQHGFVETGRVKFNDEFAPSGWNFETSGRPDIIFMAYQGGTRATIEQRTGSFRASGGSAKRRYHDSWDSAKSESRTKAMD